MSPIAAEGIPVAPGEEAMIAATPAEWVDAIATLYENEKRWQSMSSRSLAFAKSNYGFEQGMRLMQQALEQVGFFGTFPNKALVAKWARHRWVAFALGFFPELPFHAREPTSPDRPWNA